jgi:hypothetical protein
MSWQESAATFLKLSIEEWEEEAQCLHVTLLALNKGGFQAFLLVCRIRDCCARISNDSSMTHDVQPALAGW